MANHFYGQQTSGISKRICFRLFINPIMCNLFRFFAITAILFWGINGVHAQSSTSAEKNNFVFSAIKGTISKTDSLILHSTTGSIQIKWIDGDTAYFRTRVGKIPGTNQVKIVLSFTPKADFIGVARATIQITKSLKTVGEFKLTGLSSAGLEGENEPPLSHILDAFGYRTDIGWKSLANHCRPELTGDELSASLFQKAGVGEVEMIPIARYSPDFTLPFGYYTDEKEGPSKHKLGVLSTASKYPEHQTLFPSLASGKSSFDPGKKIFGFYASGSSHDAYSEDVWNMLLYPGNAVHATRIFPLKDANGNSIKNSFLLCFEEAKNGDYNDYVFLVKNISPVADNSFTDLFNRKDLKGWNLFLQHIGINKDPHNNFRVEGGILHVIGKDLGYIITQKEYRNFHFKVDFKWGVSKWPTRENAKRDAGICYNIPMNEPDSIWPQSIECQIQEGDVGDFWLLGFSTISVRDSTNKPTNHARMVKFADAEKPYSEWNTVEVISYNGKCVHIVNGVVVNVGENASVKSGRILLQSEFAEIFYRNVKIRSL
ncbi:MAG: DUF1080 domain-containing protein [Chitinophagaceae bacterium]|nr:DUF1080 domain-containing protein [Chitinophagaceae bacterium]